MYVCMYVWARVSCSRPPLHSQGGRDTWTYAYHIRIHIHIVYICTCTYYIHIHYLQYIYIHVYFRILTYYIYIHYYIHLSRIVTDLCGFSGAGLKITFGLRVMDSMTQFWCQKVGLSRLFCIILRHIFGPSKCDWHRAKSAIVRFLVAHYFSVQTKKMQLLDVQVCIHMCKYIYKVSLG
jgi:hypothetical protein